DRLILIETPFGALADGDTFETASVDGVVFDLGVSSMQIDEAERGFSFQSDGPLDMRMSVSGPSAADLVNSLGEAELADILFHYGEERRSRAIARAIVADRVAQPFTRTKQLADLVGRILKSRPGDPKHPATRTFQALRIAVNAEFDEIAAGLSGAERVLKPDGRLVVVTFHSIEDRIVKRFLAARSGKTAAVSRHLPGSIESEQPGFQLINQRPLTPGNEEINANPRARSAKLRAAIRTTAPHRSVSPDALGVPKV
ncbi:MAG: 16S rRNA (cytosine(1402)-N(4))-methyltransferase RsmH, partial [Pseudomonadota bacterium]